VGRLDGGLAGGELGVPGLDANTWYQFPKELGNVAQNATSAKTLISGLNTEDLRRGDFKATDIEVLDLLPGQVWKASNSASLAENFGTVGGSEVVDQQLKAVDKSEFKIWTCGDGYMHQITGHVEGHDPNKASDKAIADITFHIYDFNNTNITITPPANAQPFALPGIGTTPTP